MATTNIAQLRRLVFRKWNGSSWEVFTMEPDDLGQDAIMTVNIAPRMKSRSSAMGTSETPIAGTFDSFAGSITFLADNWKILGQAIQNWQAATYTGAGNNGQIIGDADNVCNQEYLSVIAQGLCDDGSATDIELTRCIPSVDDDIEVGTSDTPEITLNLHPIIYNATTHANDGYPPYPYRFGDNSLTVKQRLNAATGEYLSV